MIPAALPGTIATLHLLVRKSAHFGEYGVLFLLLVRGPMRGRPHLALLLCAAYALFDEAHQVFVPVRTASLYDVGVDFSGALFSNFVRSALAALVEA